MEVVQILLNGLCPCRRLSHRQQTKLLDHNYPVL